MHTCVGMEVYVVCDWSIAYGHREGRRRGSPCGGYLVPL